MQFFMKQSKDGDSLFTVYTVEGFPLYVIADKPAGRKERRPWERVLCADMEGAPWALIQRMGPQPLAMYRISLGGNERARVLRTPTLGGGQDYMILGPGWSLRGSPIGGSYDIVTAKGAVVMTHGCAWNAAGTLGACFAVDVPRAENVGLCLCIAAVVDSAAMVGSAAAVPT